MDSAEMTMGKFNPNFQSPNLILPNLSKGKCFVCLKDLLCSIVKIEGGSSSSPAQCHQFSLRHISRYLKFNGVDESMSDMNGVVETCVDCFKITEEFTELYRSLDEIQLRMNWCMRRMCDLMEMSNGDFGETCDFANLLSLRRRIIIRGRKKIKETDFPVVSVKRIKLMVRKEDISQHDNRKQDNPKLPLSFNDNTDSDNQPNTSRSFILNDARATSCNQNQFPTSSSAESRNQVACPFCRAVFPVKSMSPLRQQNRLREHISQYHCEYYFLNQKLDNVTHSQFQRILVDLLFQDFCIEDMGHFNCPFCPRSINASTASANRGIHLARFKLHLLDEHRQKLEAKLLQIQSDPELNEKLKTSNPHGVHCECGVYLPSSFSLSGHQMHHCTVMLSRKEGHKNVLESSPPHEPYTEPTLLENDSTTPSASCSANDQNDPLQCDYFYDENHSKAENSESQPDISHIHGGGYPAPSEILSISTANPVEPYSPEQNNWLSFDECSNIPSATAALNHGHLSCPYCRATFRYCEATLSTQQNHLNGHILQYHGEHYFPYRRLGTVTPSQYQQILVDLLFKDFCTENEGHFSCSFCTYLVKSASSKNFSAQLARFKLHLLENHRHELEAKLLLIQRDPEIDEKLRTCNPEGIHCECGVYLVSSRGLDRHRIYHCTMVTPKNNSINKPEKEVAKKLITEGSQNACESSSFRVAMQKPESSRCEASSHVESPYEVLELKMEPSPPNDNLSQTACHPKSQDFDPLSLPEINCSRDHENQADSSTSMPNPIEDACTHTSNRNDSQCNNEPSTSASANRGRLSCNFCKATFLYNESTLLAQRTNLSGHILQYHCEQYFPSQKLDTVSPPQYKQILVDLLFQGLCNETMNQYQCLWCTRTFNVGKLKKHKRSHLNRFKLHMFNEHPQQLATRLEDIQRDPMLSEKLKTCNPNGEFCECGNYLSSQGSYENHKRLHCKLSASASTTKSKPSTSSGIVKLKKKRKIACQPEVQARGHAVRSPKISERKSINWFERLPDIHNLSSNNCPYCQEKTLSNKKSLRRHIMRQHMEQLFPNARNEALVSEVQFKEILDKKLFSSLVTENKCVECGKMFTTSCEPILVKEHYVGKHYDFLRKKLALIQQDTPTPSLPHSSPVSADTRSGAYQDHLCQQQNCHCKMPRTSSTYYPMHPVAVEPVNSNRINMDVQHVSCSSATTMATQECNWQNPYNYSYGFYNVPGTSNFSNATFPAPIAPHNQQFREIKQESLWNTENQNYYGSRPNYFDGAGPYGSQLYPPGYPYHSNS